MENLRFLKAFVEEKKKDLYAEVNLLEKAIIRTPCLVLEPVKNKGIKQKTLEFKAHYIDLELAYNGVESFSSKAKEIYELMEDHELFENNFEVLEREITWDITKVNENEYYRATSTYIIDETKVNETELLEYIDKLVFNGEEL